MAKQGIARLVWLAVLLALASTYSINASARECEERNPAGADYGDGFEEDPSVLVGSFLLDNGNQIEVRAEPVSGGLLYSESGQLHKTGPAFPPELAALSTFQRYLILSPDGMPLPRALAAAERTRLTDFARELAADAVLDANDARAVLTASDRLRSLVAERGVGDAMSTQTFVNLSAMSLADRVARFAPDLSKIARGLGLRPPTHQHNRANICSDEGEIAFQDLATSFPHIRPNNAQFDLKRGNVLFDVDSSGRGRESYSFVAACGLNLDVRHQRRKTGGSWKTNCSTTINGDQRYTFYENGRKKRRRVQYDGNSSSFFFFRTATDF